MSKDREAKASEYVAELRTEKGIDEDRHWQSLLISDFGVKQAYLRGWSDCELSEKAIDTTRTKDLFDAGMAVWEYLQVSGQVTTVNAVYLPPAEALRRQADALEKKDAAILKFRAALESLRGKV